MSVRNEILFLLCLTLGGQSACALCASTAHGLWRSLGNIFLFCFRFVVFIWPTQMQISRFIIIHSTEVAPKRTRISSSRLWFAVPVASLLFGCIFSIFICFFDFQCRFVPFRFFFGVFLLLFLFLHPRAVGVEARAAHPRHRRRHNFRLVCLFTMFFFPVLRLRPEPHYAFVNIFE